MNNDQKEFWEKSWKSIPQKVEDNLKVTELAIQCVKSEDDMQHKTILDLGCGTGPDSIYFSKYFEEVYSTDFSKIVTNKLLNKVQDMKLENIHCSVQDTTKLSFNDETFDVIFASLSLHYFDDVTTRNIFIKLHQLLKPNGTLYVTCKSTSDPSIKEEEKIGENMYNQNGRIVHFFDVNYMREISRGYSQVLVENMYNQNMVQLNKSSHKSSFIKLIAKK
jgi:ubiquinone/menaquinone biosynthesis C-methylase UbiE